MFTRASSSKTKLLQKHDDDVVIVAAVRSAMTKVITFTLVRFTLIQTFRLTFQGKERGV